MSNSEIDNQAAVPSDKVNTAKDTAPTGTLDQFRAEVYGSLGAGLNKIADTASEAGKIVKGATAYLESDVTSIYNSVFAKAPAVQDGTAESVKTPEVKNPPDVPRPAVEGWQNRSSATPVDDPLGTAKIFDKDGKEVDRAKGKLDAGDYDIKMGDGRTFSMHIPANANGSTMYVLQGSMEPQFKQADFAKQTQMNAEADKDGFSVVYIHPEEHYLGQYSTQEAWAYNAPNTLIQDRNLAQAGYNDNVYMDNVRKLLPQIANIDGSAKSTAAIAFSQGTAFLRQYLTITPNFAETVGYVGAAFPEGSLAPIAPGNAESTVSVDLLADKTTLPKPGLGNESLTYLGRELAHAFADSTGLLTAYSDYADPLAPIRNDKIQDVDPVLLRELGPQLQAPDSVQFGKNKDDRETMYWGVNGNSFVDITLPGAQHAYPSNNPDNVATDGNQTYDAPVSPFFADLFMENQKKF